ncbi:MAG: glycosyl hydrolase [Candidatus Latescibacterota bacterium]
MNDLYQAFLNPSNEFTQVPWWFWNDEITEEGIREQLADFRGHGIHGFTIHARMGLPRAIPYLGRRWFELVRFAVQEAKEHGMIVHLYDEGMYPSGSAHGEVVAGHPEFLARGLQMRYVKSLKAPDGNIQEKCVAFMPEGQTEAVAIAAADRIPHNKPGWIFVSTPTHGRIRGVHEGEDDGEAGAPFAADLLNPEAVRRFIRCTHERYYERLSAYFGDPIRAMFTDEPSILGRYPKEGLIPWTDGLETYFREKKGCDLIPHLPALFGDTCPSTGNIRRDYEDLVAERLNESFYKPISDWCAAHHIALTGHPSLSDDIGPLRYFGLPGQDTVLRHVELGKATLLEGPDSTVGKCASSAARHGCARRNGNEVFGGYGWNLTFDEMKGLSDWLMVRGVNLLWPHAFYYSIRGTRAHERPPDVGPHNLWWKHYRLLAEYTKRLCALLTDSQQVCELAILGRHNQLPWEPAKVLFQHQRDFNYLEDRLLARAVPAEGRIQIGGGRIFHIDSDEGANILRID